MPGGEGKRMNPSEEFSEDSETQYESYQKTLSGSGAADCSEQRQVISEKPKLVHIFGPPNSGKTTLRKTLGKRHPEYQNYCIDDFRREYGDWTFRGETDAQNKFWDAMWRGGFVECSGSGRFTERYLYCFRKRTQYIVVMDTPVDVCISRVRDDKYDGIPFPFHGTPEGYIRDVSEFLNSWHFNSMTQGIPVLRLNTNQSPTEQAKEVERFAGLCCEPFEI